MRVIRINQNRPVDPRDSLKKQKRKYRKTKRLIKESEIPRITDITNALNGIPGFTYLDFNRNAGAINLFKHQIDQVISNYGMDLIYFRKYNTFFKDESENNSNLIYGEDTTAKYYVSGAIRAFVSVESMAWNFNQLGIEAAEQILIFMTIQNFEQTFANKIGQIETKYFEVPVSGNLINNEITGLIKTPEFSAQVYGAIDEKLNIKYEKITMIDKAVNDSFYLSRSYDTTEYPISGLLKGRLRHDSENPFNVYGLLEGDLSYHSLQNVEDSSSWGLAPQVGDYFVMKTPTGISEEWEISNIFDKNLTKNGLNPLLGKYVYQISAVRRTRSHEENTEELNFKEPGQDVAEILGNISKPPKKEEYSEAYREKNGENIQNKKTNKLGKNVFNYEDGADSEYGGYQTDPTST